MICYRRFIRKQLVAILLTLFIGLWFFIKSKSFTIISKNSDDEQLQSNNLPVDGKEADSEIERLSNFQKSKDFEYRLINEHEQMMKKYNKSLKIQSAPSKYSLMKWLVACCGMVRLVLDYPISLFLTIILASLNHQGVDGERGTTRCLFHTGTWHVDGICILSLCSKI